MASRKARAFLSAMGLGIDRPHTALERSNFSVGTGHGKYAMPYQVIRFRESTGDSKTTMAWASNLDDAYAKMDAIKDAHYTDGNLSRYGYYIRDIRNGKIRR